MLVLGLHWLVVWAPLGTMVSKGATLVLDLGAPPVSKSSINYNLGQCLPEGLIMVLDLGSQLNPGGPAGDEIRGILLSHKTRFRSQWKRRSSGHLA